MREAIRSFVKDESGATAIEYSLMVALIGIAIITAMRTLTFDLFTLINDVAAALLAANQ